MDFNIVDFVNRLQELFVNNENFPVSDDIYVDKSGRWQETRNKHKKRNPLHLKDIAREKMKNNMTITDSMITFDYGGPAMELVYPHYHILQQAPTIQKAYRGTAKTKGSQDKIFSKRRRDYEQVSFGGKFGGKLVKEYSKNVRGSRLDLKKTSYWSGGKTSYGSFLNAGENKYLNIHYDYINKTLDEVAPILANEFGLKLGRKQDTGLTEEMAMQWGVDESVIVDILNSFN